MGNYVSKLFLKNYFCGGDKAKRADRDRAPQCGRAWSRAQRRVRDPAVELVARSGDLQSAVRWQEGGSRGLV